jgi:hypothetical protein
VNAGNNFLNFGGGGESALSARARESLLDTGRGGVKMMSLEPAGPNNVARQ